MTGLQKALAGLALLAALIGGGTIGTAGIGHKFGLWQMPVARLLLEYGFYGAAGGAALGVLTLLIALLRQRGGGAFGAILAIAAGAGAAYVPWTMHQKELTLPALHDISTDTQDPPAFVALANERANFENGAAYDSAAAAKQKEAYPDIAPLRSVLPPDRLFAKVLAAAKALGWQIVAQSVEEGRIEATAVSEWFGFKDDIAIRIVADGAGARLDMRSASRTGAHDLGANADRVRAFLAGLR